jgi:hypothetical protein
MRRFVNPDLIMQLIFKDAGTVGRKLAQSASYVESFSMHEITKCDRDNCTSVPNL